MIKGNFIENQKKIIKHLLKKKIYIYIYMKSFMEGIEKFYVIKGFYINFVTLKGKFNHQSQITSKFGQCI